MKKKKMGRPTLPKGQSKDVQVGVRFTPSQDSPIDKAVSESGQTKADWIRSAAITQSRQRRIWVKSKWKWEELDKKTVAFEFTSPSSVTEGIGEFMVWPNPKGEVSIDIAVRTMETPFKMVLVRLSLSQEAADRIEKNPNAGSTHFRLLA